MKFGYSRVDNLATTKAGACVYPFGLDYKWFLSD